MLQENEMRMSPNYDYIQFSAMSPTKISLPKQAHEIRETYYTGDDNSNKACFGRTTKFLREYGNFAGNREGRNNFRET